MLDAFGSDNPDDYIAGFPDHPHRGFETMTYMLKGRMLHEDSEGNQGLLQNGVMAGFQLWINLPAHSKMADPWYQDFQRADLPQYLSPEGHQITVLAGTSQGVPGAVQRPDTDPLILDVHFSSAGTFTHELPTSHNAFLVVYEGSARLGDQVLTPHQLVLLANDGNQLHFEAEANTQVLIVAGKPLHEPIVQYGPFVMNSSEQIHQAIQDFRNGTLTL